MKSSNLIESLRNVDTSSLVDRVEKNLIELFIEKEFKVGDTIPTELELTEAMGVSRTVIREALLRLRMNPQMLDEATLREIFEMRLSLEIGMADFIVQRVTDKDIADLKAIVKSEPKKAQTHLFQIEQEIKFHGKLYDITGNETLKNFQKMLLPVFDYVHQSGLLKKQVVLKEFVSHAGLIKLIEEGSAEKLRNGIRNHLENHFVRLFD